MIEILIAVAIQAWMVWAKLETWDELKAITLFRASIGVPGDPNRYPDAAIEAGRKGKETASSK